MCKYQKVYSINTIKNHDEYANSLNNSFGVLKSNDFLRKIDAIEFNNSDKIAQIILFKYFFYKFNYLLS